MTNGSRLDKSLVTGRKMPTPRRSSGVCMITRPSISMFEGRPLSGFSPYAGPGFDRLARGMHQAISPPKTADEKTRSKGLQLRWAPPVGGDRVDGVGPLPVVDKP